MDLLPGAAAEAPVPTRQSTRAHRAGRPARVHEGKQRRRPEEPEGEGEQQAGWGTPRKGKGRGGVRNEGCRAGAFRHLRSGLLRRPGAAPSLSCNFPGREAIGYHGGQEGGRSPTITSRAKKIVLTPHFAECSGPMCAGVQHEHAQEYIGRVKASTPTANLLSLQHLRLRGPILVQYVNQAEPGWPCLSGTPPRRRSVEIPSAWAELPIPGAKLPAPMAQGTRRPKVSTPAVPSFLPRRPPSPKGRALRRPLPLASAEWGRVGRRGQAGSLPGGVTPPAVPQGELSPSTPSLVRGRRAPSCGTAASPLSCRGRPAICTSPP